MERKNNSGWRGKNDFHRAAICPQHHLQLFFEKQKKQKIQKSVDFWAGLSYNTKRAADEANKKTTK